MLLQANNSSAHYKPKDKAFNFVLRMAAAVLGVCLACALIWWYASDRNFNTLGRYINITGIIFMIIGIISISGRSQIVRSINRKKLTQIEKQRKNIDADGINKRMMMFLFGVGLLCLFIGNMIIVGL